MLAALGFGLRYWLGSRQSQPAPEPKLSDTSARGGAQPVGVATVGLRDIHVILPALGTVTPLATVTVVSQISGVLEKVGFVEGQMVKKGDFLAQIDDRPYQALKAQYEGQIAHDQGLLEQARIDDARYQRLLKQNSIASQTAEDQKYIVKQYEGTVASDQALIDAQALNIAYCHIVSPVDGRVGLRLIDSGNYVVAGTPASSSSSSSGLVVVTQTQPISVIFSIPEDSLRRVAPQLRAGKTLSAEVYDRSNIKLLGRGETRAIDNQVDSTTGMVKLRAYFDNADEALFANQFVNVRLLASTIYRRARRAGCRHPARRPGRLRLGDLAGQHGVDRRRSSSARWTATWCRSSMASRTGTASWWTGPTACARAARSAWSRATARRRRRKATARRQPPSPRGTSPPERRRPPGRRGKNRASGKAGKAGAAPGKRAPAKTP